MKSKKKLYRILLLNLLICGNILFGTILINFTDNKSKDQDDIVEIPRGSYYNNSMDPFYIDAIANGVGAHNWTWAASKPWCFGNGSRNNPYRIENLTINALGSPINSGIIIENSQNVYFTIKNCTITNVNNATVRDHRDYAGGIKLLNSSKGLIINNTFSDGGANGCGILAYENSFNITLEDNLIRSNGRHGILLDAGREITILKNHITSIAYQGIYLYNGCENNTIESNYVESANQVAMSGSNAGIRLYNYNHNNTIFNNTVLSCWRGIYLRESRDNEINSNIVKNNFETGIVLSTNSDNVNVTDNIVSNDHGVTNQNFGMWLAGSHNNNIKDNNINNNIERGIYIYSSDSNKISGNNVNNSGETGILLDSDSDDNTIYFNLITENNYSISITDSTCEDNLVYHNNFTQNVYNAVDNGLNTQWDTGFIGNYWDNFTDSDTNDDGIGDTLNYTISGTAGTEDAFPFCNDGYSGGNLYVDGIGYYSWNWQFSSTFSWCSGSGSWSDPFTIEDLILDATGSSTGSGIYIRNSKDEFFQIRNCTINNAGSGAYDAGIKLENTQDGILVDNNCSYNGRNGIMLYYKCYNNTIVNNIATYNSYFGIGLYGNTGESSTGCNNNIVEQNDVNDNTYYGIVIAYYGKNNVLRDNDVTYNMRDGIYLYYSCEDNLVYSNTIWENGYSGWDAGIYVQSNCHGNILTDNSIGSQMDAYQEYGIFLESNCYENLISDNIVFENDKNGIYLYNNCDDNTIKGNTVNNVGPVNQECAIYLESDCDENNITDNIINYASYSGIRLEDNCDHNSITKNRVRHGFSDGIALEVDCDWNIISFNTITDNLNGIYILDGLENNITNNDCNLNRRAGINIWINCLNTIISDNNIMNNGISGVFEGIRLYSSDNTTIIGNIIGNEGTSYQDYGIHIDPSAEDNIILHNYLIQNGVNARDNGVNNQWNDTLAGNYYSDYAGDDVDDNGIGDTPCGISGTAGSIDYLPIWDDGPEWLPGEPIYIDGSLTGYGDPNWAWALRKGICTGSGTVNDPYVIENMTIDASTSSIGSGILINNSNTENFRIRNCTIFDALAGTVWWDNNGGIKLMSSSKGQIYSNNLTSTTGADTWKSGICLYESKDISIINNTIEGNTYGVFLRNSNESLIFNNSVDSNYHVGIYLQANCHYNNVTQNFASSNTLYHGIALTYNSENNNIINNTANENYQHGIYLYSDCDNNTVSSNDVYYNGRRGILLYSGCDRNRIINNTANSNGIATGDDPGLSLEGNCDYNYIAKNKVYNNTGYGAVHLENGCDNNTVIRNIVYNNSKHGVLFEVNCNENILSSNKVYHNYWRGIILKDFCSANTIINNTVINNGVGFTDPGISLYNTCNLNNITGNFIRNNETTYQDLGIKLESNSDGNWITNNIINDNFEYGIYLAGTCDDNTIYQNFFRQNGVNAYDDGSNNKWNSITIGNYWHNYTGYDSDDDGIGDTPYMISGSASSQDNFPIWDDGDDINPTISINSPSPLTFFGEDAPTYSLDIFDLNLNQSWYTLNGTSTRYYFTPSNGINIIPIEEFAWDTFADGLILMTFYVNDSNGNPTNVSNTIMKDVTNPTAIINSPPGGTTFGADAPEFNLTIYDLNLNNAWYTIGSSGTTHSFTPSNGINIVPINQISWDALLEGNVTINFFVNDTAGNIRNIQVSINKDLPSSSKGIPFGNYFLIVMGISAIALIIATKKKTSKKK